MTAYSGSTKDIKDIIAPCYYELHRDIREHGHIFYNLPGGRGSCKSSFASIEIVLGIMRDRTGQSNAIVFRLVAGTLRESVFSQIQWAIDTLGVSHLWKSKVSPMQFEYVNGAQIVFRGLDDALKLKSIKPKKGSFAFIWFEEFSELPGELLLRSVQQSVMRGRDNFIVFRSFNPPISANNWANRYIQIPDEKSITLLTDYTMIPPEWLGESFILEAERLKDINLTAYRHEYMGEPVGTGGEVFPNIEVREISDDELMMRGDYIFQGLDFGFAVDPAAFVWVHYDSRKEEIYFLDEIYVRGWSNVRMAQEIKGRKYNHDFVICDWAEPKSIVDLKDNEVWFARGCYKRPGCVNVRIKWLQHRKLIFDPRRTPNAYREFSTYSYDIDKNGIVLSQVPDKDNHTIDATAYGLDPVIFRRGTAHRKERSKMEYLKVKCHRCGNSFHLYNRDMSSEEKPPHCPHCLVLMDKTQWERLVNAYFTFAEVNKNFRKYHTDRGEPLFQIELLTEKKYVKPQKIVLDDGFTGQTGAGMCMEEALGAMPKPLADIVRNPVPNRNMEDFEN